MPLCNGVRWTKPKSWAGEAPATPWDIKAVVIAVAYLLLLSWHYIVWIFISAFTKYLHQLRSNTVVFQSLTLPPPGKGILSDVVNPLRAWPVANTLLPTQKKFFIVKEVKNVVSPPLVTKLPTLDLKFNRSIPQNLF